MLETEVLPETYHARMAREIKAYRSEKIAEACDSFGILPANLSLLTVQMRNVAPHSGSSDDVHTYTLRTFTDTYSYNGKAVIQFPPAVIDAVGFSQKVIKP